MCKSLLVEDFESVLCAFQKEHKNRTISRDYVKMSKTEMDSRLVNVDTNTYYYGILTVGKGSTMELILEESCLFELASNTQIIEVFQGIQNVVGANYYFRGWVFTID